MCFRWYLLIWPNISSTPRISSPSSVFSRLPGPTREKSNSFSVIPLQRKASVWIIRR